MVRERNASTLALGGKPSKSLRAALIHETGRVILVMPVCWQICLQLSTLFIGRDTAQYSLANMTGHSSASPKRAPRGVPRDPLHNSGETVACGSGWAVRRLFAANSPAIGKKNNEADRPSPRDHRPQGVMQRVPSVVLHA